MQKTIRATSQYGDRIYFYTAYKSALEPTQSLTHWVPRSRTTQVKRPERKTVLLSPCSAQVKNASCVSWRTVHAAESTF